MTLYLGDVLYMVANRRTVILFRPLSDLKTIHVEGRIYLLVIPYFSLYSSLS